MTRPDWYDESKLERVYYSPDLHYTDWVINLGDGTCRYANSPLMGEYGPSWGDRVPLIEVPGHNLRLADHTKVIERYECED